MQKAIIIAKKEWDLECEELEKEVAISHRIFREEWMKVNPDSEKFETKKRRTIIREYSYQEDNLPLSEDNSNFRKADSDFPERKRVKLSENSNSNSNIKIEEGEGEIRLRINSSETNNEISNLVNKNQDGNVVISKAVNIRNNKENEINDQYTNNVNLSNSKTTLNLTDKYFPINTINNNVKNENIAINDLKLQNSNCIQDIPNKEKLNNTNTTTNTLSSSFNNVFISSNDIDKTNQSIFFNQSYSLSNIQNSLNNSDTQITITSGQRSEMININNLIIRILRNEVIEDTHEKILLKYIRHLKKLSTSIILLDYLKVNFQFNYISSSDFHLF